MASLYHDDVMDEADLRRSADTANAHWDNHVAILTGDFLFGRSSDTRPHRTIDALLRADAALTASCGACAQAGP